MVQKQKIRPLPMDDPPTASSSEEQASSQEEEEEVSSDDDKEQNLSPGPKTQTQTETESGSESESESESESDTIPAKVEPVASKPKEQAQKPKAQPSQTPSKSGSKRPADSSTDDSGNGSDAKRSKNKSSDVKTKDDEKKTPRRWSEDEELAILKGVLDFTSKMKQDPLKISNAFHDFMTKLPDWEEVSRDQLKAKLRSLKRKFDTNAAKEENGETLSFSKPHEQKVFELSKKAWGTKPNELVEKPKSNGNAASSKKAKPDNKRETKSEVVLSESEKMDIDRELDGGNVGLILGELSRFKEIVQLDEDELKRGLELIGESKRAELEQKWKEIRYAEVKLLAKRSQLIAEQTNLMIDALQPSDDYDSQ